MPITMFDELSLPSASVVGAGAGLEKSFGASSCAAVDAPQDGQNLVPSSYSFPQLPQKGLMFPPPSRCLAFSAYQDAVARGRVYPVCAVCFGLCSRAGTAGRVQTSGHSVKARNITPFYCIRFADKCKD
jgi:hypothetical protein